jgi:hypothetical protein
MTERQVFGLTNGGNSPPTPLEVSNSMKLINIHKFRAWQDFCKIIGF